MDKQKVKEVFCQVKSEFSKLFCILVALAIGAYAVWSGIRYYQLVELAITLSNGEYTVMPPIELAVVGVTGILVSLVSYLCYQGFLKNSLNKNQLTIDDKTGLVTPVSSDALKEVIKEQMQENMLCD